ncbi:MAG: hypothetical protein COB02_08835 [Candidatus Cloacimonadota bacterium]|nr:MAG: hypothetical protein COB02_08835 [Candidatus Cloacimonadota bacterium]
MSVCEQFTLFPEPYLFASINKMSNLGIRVLDLDSSLSLWLEQNQKYFERNLIIWHGLNSKKDLQGCFCIKQSFLEQSVEKSSIDFQVLNFFQNQDRIKEIFQKSAYCSRDRGRLLYREIIFDNILDLQKKNRSNEELKSLIIESGYSDCSISLKEYPLQINNLSDYKVWLIKLLELLGINDFKENLQLEKDFIFPKIKIREAFAIK